jgi:Mrp family chromosome partitioning ATPase
LLTSPCPGDGKTTCALALAALLAADGKRVLVIDADLRRANLDLLLSAEEAGPPGLREVLRGEQAWMDALVTVQSEGGAFYLLPSGGEAPVELLSTPRMSQLLDETRKRCDYVLLDAPSFPAVSDALVLARMTDSVLSVVRIGNSDRALTYGHVRGLASEAAQHTVLLNDLGQATSTRADESRSARKEHEPSASAVRKPPRSRALAWWTAALMLLAAALAAAARVSPRAAQVIGSSSSSRHAG